MAVGAFTSRDHQPSADEIQKTIGGMLQGWHDLAAFIRENYGAREDVVFLYGKEYGWAKRFRVRGKLLTSLYPIAGGFTVQVILSSNAVERAMKMRLGRSVREAILRATPYPEGRWLFVPVRSMQDLIAAQRLLALKAGAFSARGSA
ncbi:MAG TPA: DUF3788 family protein [Bryobacteraceae bacterium]|nr:DUF3788 family protein [Bryobacteraceae bacterium]